MSPVRPAARGAQRGYTLVGMMVGLALSLLTIVAMLALYKTMIDLSSDATRSAERSGQLGAATLAAELELQQAGFGIEPGEAGENLLVAAGQVVWRFRELGAAAADYQCAGLRLATADDGPRGLYLLPATPCTSADDAGLTWSAPGQPLPQQLASESAFHVATGEVAVFPLADATFVQAAGTACFPYAQTATTDLSPQVQLLALGEPMLSVCLPNLAVAPPPPST